MSREQLSAADVAILLGLKAATIAAYRRDQLMPPADGMLGRTPWWFRDTIEEWWASRPGRGAYGGRPRKGVTIAGVGFDSRGLGAAYAAYGLVSLLPWPCEVSVTRAGAVRVHAEQIAAADDLVDALIEQPWIPAFTPWNQACGLYGPASGARDTMAALADSSDLRLAPSRAALTVFGELVGFCEQEGSIRDGRIVDKAAVIATTRRGLSGAVAAWPRACVEVSPGAPSGYAVNPATASGGNAGRSEWSVIYARAMLAMADAPDRGRAWWSALITGEPTALLRDTASSFLDPLGSSTGTLNPAWMIAVMHGMARLRGENHAAAYGAAPTVIQNWLAAPRGNHLVASDVSVGLWPGVSAPVRSVVFAGNPAATVGLPVPPVGVRVDGLHFVDRLGDPPAVVSDRWRVARYLVGSSGTVPVAQYLDLVDGALEQQLREAPHT